MVDTLPKVMKTHREELCNVEVFLFDPYFSNLVRLDNIQLPCVCGNIYSNILPTFYQTLGLSILHHIYQKRGSCKNHFHLRNQLQIFYHKNIRCGIQFLLFLYHKVCNIFSCILLIIPIHPFQPIIPKSILLFLRQVVFRFICCTHHH